MTTNDPDERRETLERQRQQRQAALESILDLLEKAQERSADEPENEGKWRRKLNQLWSSFDEAKARLNEIEGTIARAERSAGSSHSALKRAVENPVGAKPAPVSGSSTGAGVSSEPRRVALTVGSLPGRAFHERRRQILMRCAIDKVRSRRISAMTAEELDLALEILDTLAQRIERDSTSEKLAQFLAKVDISVVDTCAEMRRLRAHRYAKKGR